MRIFKHKCRKRHLIFCGSDEFYWCKKCKREFDYPWKDIQKIIG